jgi:2-methylcitrate dehydratase PrpD
MVAAEMTDDERYRVAMLDWLACAARGRLERAATAAATAGDGLLDRVAAAAAAGHVLDFDDTWTPGLAHLSAPTAPAALCVAADAGLSVGAALNAYADGFEAMAALASASHPALYDAGRHPTAVCGAVGAAVAAGAVLGFGEEARAAASGVALLGAGGLLAAFGSDGKALQVAMAAASGVQAALLAAGGARVHEDALERYAPGIGASWEEPRGEPAVRTNWIKAYPCCLQTHTAIEAALAARGGEGGEAIKMALAARGDEGGEAVDAGGEATRPALDGPVTLAIHPLARAAASVDDPEDGLQAKFSLPYLVAFALERGAPGVEDFDVADLDVRAAAARIELELDPSLGEQEAVLRAGGEELARVDAALGSPERPMSGEQLTSKVRSLAGDRLDGILEDPDRPAADVLTAAGLH